MDLFLSICQGIGLALAAGALAGAPGRAGRLGRVLLIFAIAGGAVLFALALEAEDYAAWPGIPAGAALAPLGFFVSSRIAAGARERAAGGVGGAEGSPVAISATVAITAVALGALVTLLPPLSLIMLALFGWLALGQMRRDRRKYEGLRVLR
jgi:hypothetical protein